MAAYLADHPAIFFSEPKEPFYFGRDFLWRTTHSLEAYEKLFRDADPQQHRAVGEGTIYYLFSKLAVAEILAYNSEARFIVMLRNPLEMVPAYHAQHLVNGFEDITDFETAWRAHEQRVKGRNIPPRCPDSQFINYRKWGRLGEQVQRLLTLVPRDRVHIILYDDFSNDTESAYRSTLEFLGVPPDDRKNFKPVNVSKQPRKPQLFRFLGGFLRQGLALRKLLGLRDMRFGILKRFEELFIRLCFVERQREPLSAGLRSELAEYFHDDVQLLERQLDRPLSRWLQVTSPAEGSLLQADHF
jgi:hypothetical protein